MIGFHQKTARLKNGVVFCSLSSFDRENSYSEPVANYSRGPWYAAAALITDYFMACPTRRAARLLSADPARGKNSTFLYHFLGAKHAPRLRPLFGCFVVPFFHMKKAIICHDRLGTVIRFRRKAHPNNQTACLGCVFAENPADLGVSGGGGSCHSCEIPFVFNSVRSTNRFNCVPFSRGKSRLNALPRQPRDKHARKTEWKTRRRRFWRTRLSASWR